MSRARIIGGGGDYGSSPPGVPCPRVSRAIHGATRFLGVRSSKKKNAIDAKQKIVNRVVFWSRNAISARKSEKTNPVMKTRRAGLV
jgi:hypothetical protein